MASFEEDLEYCKDIYKMIKWFMFGMADEIPGFGSELIEGVERKWFYNDVEEFRSDVVVSYYNKKTLSFNSSYCTNYCHFIHFENELFSHYNYDNFKSNIPLYEDVYSESEYFQNSLLYPDDVNRSVLLFSYLKSRRNDLNNISFLEINVRTLDKVLGICKHDLTFPRYKALIGE